MPAVLATLQVSLALLPFLVTVIVVGAFWSSQLEGWFRRVGLLVTEKFKLSLPGSFVASSLCIRKYSEWNGGRTDFPGHVPHPPPISGYSNCCLSLKGQNSFFISCMKSFHLIDDSDGALPYPRSCTNLQAKTILANC